MIIGQTIFKPQSGSYVSPWFPRQGDGAVFSAELIARSDGGSLVPVVYHKNLEETDSSISIVWTIGTLSTAGTVVSKEFTGLKELVRFSYQFVNGTAGVDWVHFRVLPPSWKMNGA